MANARLVIAQVLAGIAVALAAFGMIGENSITGMQTGMPGHSGLAASHVPGLISLGLSVTAFILSWKQRSYLVAGLLSAAGITYTIHLAPFLGDHSIIAFPGPIVGLFLGHVILALGLAKATGSTRTKLVQSPN